MIGGHTSVPICSGERNPDPKNLLLVPVHHFFVKYSVMKRLYRQDNKVFAGVCSGLGKYLDLDEVIIRLIFVGLFFSPFPIVIFYLIMWILIPKQPNIIDNL